MTTPSANPNAAWFEVRNLSLHYGKKLALGNVDLTIDNGKITALVGPSGCGKSSLLMALNRLTDLIPGCHVTGSVRIDCCEVHDKSTDVITLRRRVGMIFQRPNPFPFSIRKNLTLALREQGVRNRQELADRVEGALRDVGLWREVCDRLDDAAHTLSGGQQQRLCLARALALQPEVLLLDEPCSQLDPIASGVVEDLMVSLRGRLTLIVVTHNLAQARRIADRVAVFWNDGDGGRLLEAGDTSQIFDAPVQEQTKAYVTGQRG